MNQLVTPPHVGLKSLKHRLFAPLRRGMLIALLLCTAWAAQAQNLTVSLNNGTPLTSQASLEAAINASGMALGDITSIEITAGSFTTEDWNYLKNNRYYLSSLESFTITDGISSVANMPDLFQESYFSSISSVSIDANFAVGAWAFYDRDNLSSISLPKVTNIGKSAFYGCDALTTVKIPSVTSFGDAAFQFCIALSFLELGATLPTVAHGVFGGCPSPRYLSLVAADGSSLEEAALTTAVNAYKGVDDDDPNDNLWYGWRVNEKPKQLSVKVNGGSDIPNKASLQEAIEASGVSPDGIIQLEVLSGDLLTPDAAYMKSSLTALVKLTLTTAKEFGVKLKNHNSLQEIHAPKLEIVGREAFEYCHALTTLDLPAATSIDASAFCGCSALTEVSLPAATWIHDWAFLNCSALTTVRLPVATTIGGNAFSGCSALTTVSLPAATSIGHRAFRDCSALITVSLPVATKIGSNAFVGCNTLISLELGATPPTLEANNAFAGCPSPRYLSLIDADGNPLTGTERTTALANYKADANWDNTTSTWAGWSLMLSITATANPAEGGIVSGAGSTAIGSTVTLEATPNEGYRFVRWTDGTNERSTGNPYSFTATDDAELVAEFEVITYTLSYTASTGGSITGQATQTVAHGQSGTEVEAVPADGYQFLRWSDGLTTAKRTDANIKADRSVEAEFIDASINVYTLTYTAASGGSVRGAAKQRVADGESGTEVEAVPNAGYRFVRWSDGLTTAKRTDSNVQGDITVTAEFAIITYTLSYTAGEGGSITGQTTQSVQHGQSGTEVEAVPSGGYVFKKWSDGNTSAKRTDSNVHGNVSVKAEFEKQQEEGGATGLFDIRRDSVSERHTCLPSIIPRMEADSKRKFRRSAGFVKISAARICSCLARRNWV